MSVFTALLFGLLFLVFNLAVTMRKDGKAIANAHDLSTIVRDLRSIITYSIVVAVVMVVVLAVSTQFAAAATGGAPVVTPSPLPSQSGPAVPVASDPSSALSWVWTPILIWLGVHLVLNILSVLTRFRTAFNYLAQ